ncbi:MAG: hypothetical protein HFG68_00905 [Hungatella sp.]|nr:hypothetical protein [Hungatella sp.]
MIQGWNYNYFTDKFKYIPEKIHAVCIGTTQAHFAFDFSMYDVQGFNMAVWLNYFTYSKLLLEKYKNKIADQAVIFITLQYPIFLCDKNSSLTIDNALQYSKILFGKDPEASFMKQCIYRILPDCCFSQENFFGIRNIESRNKKVNHYKIWELEQMTESVINAWEKETNCNAFRYHLGSITRYHQTKMQNSINDVVEIINLCRKNQWIPVLTTLPFSKIMNDRISEKFKKYYFYQCIEKIVEKTNCLWLDYSWDKRLEDINYYMDVWWLNERGRKRFTGIVLEEYERFSNP